MIITTSSRETRELAEEAGKIAELLQIDCIQRNKKSLASLQALYQDVLILSQEGLVLHLENGEKLSFHPDTAILRMKAPRDPLLELIGQEPLTILDTTMGLASDSIVMASQGHQLMALEKSPVIHLIVSRGLATYQTSFTALEKAMRSIKTCCADSLTYLKAQLDQSVDIIYCDPMFSENIAESHNLAGLEQLADYSTLTPAFLAEAKRVARKKIILKAHFRDDSFERFGFQRLVRPNQKFHYGVIELEENN